MGVTRQDSDQESRIFESARHERNFGMTAMLAGARVQEKAAAGGSQAGITLIVNSDEEGIGDSRSANGSSRLSRRRGSPV
jgi:hypothetical protein